jgi:c-di-GMP-binding flagellar brake protein YcgR
MTPSKKPSEERRREPRVGATFPVKYKVLDEQGRARSNVKGSAINISGSGVRFHTDEKLDSGCLISAELRLPKADADVIAVGKVAWSRPAHEGGFEVGVEFWWMGWRSEDAQQALADYVKSKLPKKAT